VPAAAPAVPPETGASIMAKPLTWASSATSRAACGAMVLLSISSAPGFAASSTPPSPR